MGRHRRTDQPTTEQPTTEWGGDVPEQVPSAQVEVVDLCRELIRIDSSNYGDGSGPGERAAAEYVAAELAEVGLEPTVHESADRRTSLVVRWEGEDSGRPALLIHGHLDDVPAQADDWTRDPFGGELVDDCVWGRGAVDMKDMDAMVLALVRQWRREGRKPPRDVVLAFLADEEAGGVLGAHWLVDHHPGLFEGVSEAISEVGGFSFSLPDGQRAYLIETAQKGIQWLRLVAKGRAGHGSMVADDNAITRLAEAVARVGNHDWPVRLTPTVRRFLEEMSDALALEFDPDDPDASLGKLGSLARIVGATLRNTANPTILRAGYKHNVIPQTAEAFVDCRFLPGFEDELLATIDELIGPDVSRETVVQDIALETTFDGALVDAMVAALQAEDPGSRAIPYSLSGGTDNKSFSLLGVRGFGFAPLRLPADLDFSGMFHGVDERVPVDSLQFGVRVLDRFLASS
jgi:acetylornithine deacetylase/succinyl-diaminopimelate desuccinylase-like protein